MTPVSGVSSGRPVTAAERILGAPKVRKEEDQSRPLKPVMDEYVPEEPRESSGRYWMGKDQEGQPKIYFDDPERAVDAPKQPEAAPDAGKPEADAPEKPEENKGAKGPERKKDEVWECNTDKVDREIEKLKKKRQELEQRLGAETDEAKIKDLERQLAQVERELSEKDNDTYRRQHSRVTRLR